MSESPLGEADESTNPASKSVCNTCDVVFDTRHKLQHHVKVTDTCGFECPTCGDSRFVSERGVEIHHAKVHGVRISGEMVDCDNCGETFREEKHRVESFDHHFCDRECFKVWMGDGNALSGKDHHWYGWRRTGEDNPSYKGGLMDAICDYCGGSFQRTPSEVEKYDLHFCTRECKGGYWSENFSGENHPDWKGGKVKYYGSNWTVQREKALERDNHACRWCGASENSLGKSPDVHHIQRIKTFKENYDAPEWWVRGNRLENLITFCRACHKKWEGIPVAPHRNG